MRSAESDPERHPARAPGRQPLSPVRICLGVGLCWLLTTAGGAIAQPVASDRAGADAALAGAFFYQQRLGDPAAAARAAGRLPNPARVLLEADAAALGGDYPRAVQLAGTADARSLSAEQLEVLRLKKLWWERSIGSWPDGTDPPGSPVARDRRWQEGKRAWPPASAAGKALLRRLNDAVSAQAGLSTLAMGVAPPEIQRTVLGAMDDVAHSSNCPEGRRCWQGTLVVSRALVLAGQPQQAYELLVRAHAEAVGAGDRIGAGVLETAMTDLQAAPAGSPATLNLILRDTSQRMAQHARVSAPIDASVSPAVIAWARKGYQQARAQLATGGCPRCLADLDLRDGYLDFAAGQYQESARRLDAAALAYRESGDVLGEAQATLAAGAAVLADGGKKLDGIERVLARTRRDRFFGLASVASYFLLGCADWLKNVHNDAAGALVAAELAERFASVGGNDTVTWIDCRRRRVNLLGSLGRHREEFSLAHEVWRSLQRRSDELLSWAIAVEFALDAFNALMGADDLPAAAKLLDELRQAGRRPPPRLPEGMALPIDIPSLVPVYEWQLDMFSRQYAQALEGAVEMRDRLKQSLAHIALGQPERALPLLREAADAALDVVRAPPPAAWSADLVKRQGAVNDLRNVVQQLIAADRPDLARGIWSRAEPALAGQGLFDDVESPWLKDQLAGEIAEGEARSPADLSRALDYYGRAVRALERMAPQVAGTEAEEGLLSRAGDSYRLRTRTLFKQGQVELALTDLEGWRSRSLHQRLAAASLSRERTGPEASALRQLWVAEARRSRILRNLSLRPGDAASSAADLQAAEQRVHAARAALVDLHLEDNAQQTWSRGSALSALAENLPENTVALVYFLADQGWVVAVGPRGLLGLRELKLRERKLRPEINELIGRLGHSERQDWPAQAQKLHATVFAPVADLLPRGSGTKKPQLLVVPYGVLHTLPFQALSDGKALLIESYDLLYAPSIQSFVRARQAAEKTATATDVVAFGFNSAGLNSAEGEAKRVTPAAFVGHRATLANLRRQTERASVLHLAGHFERNSENPEASALVLADGRLDLLSVFELRLRAPLVFLSACSSATAERTRLDDPSGLEAAFFAAGAATLVVTGWNIDDERTAQLTRSFYAALRRGERPVSALADAQREAISRSWHPAYWAAFSVVGSDR